VAPQRFSERADALRVRVRALRGALEQRQPGKDQPGVRRDRSDAARVNLGRRTFNGGLVAQEGGERGESVASQ
jgi:hypothetical protein